jgi:ribonuclease G
MTIEIAKGKSSMADKQLIINTTSLETRIALLERDRVAELFIERQSERGIVGNVYLGVVMRVLPGMQSAFINIGADRTAFLYGGDVIDPEALRETHVSEDITTDPGEPHSAPTKKLASPSVALDLTTEDLKDRNLKSRRPIEKLIKEGQEILVQVAKEPLGSKGARVTTFISIPGRYLVLMPDFTHIGISRRIEDPAERLRLSNLVKEFKPDNVGVIVRTAALGVSDLILQKDLKYLLKVWRLVDAKRKRSSPPSLIYRDLSLILKTTRDLYSEDIDRIVIDDSQTCEELRRFLMATIPGAHKKLYLYDEKTPIFDVYGIEMDIGRALSSRIELPSGGYLIIDQTEALTSFDVNTGKFVGHASARDTILKTNLESVQKIVAQLRTRNIGGIIVIDFIDMEKIEDREKVFNALQEELKADKARTNVLKISELGLVQMTRKRTSESLERTLMEPCPYCEGRGRIRSTATESYDLLREIRRHTIQTGDRKITVRVRDDIKSYLEHEAFSLFQDLINEFNITIEFKLSSLTKRLLDEAPYEVISPFSP